MTTRCKRHVKSTYHWRSKLVGSDNKVQEASHRSRSSEKENEETNKIEVDRFRHFSYCKHECWIDRLLRYEKKASWLKKVSLEQERRMVAVCV